MRQALDDRLAAAAAALADLEGRVPPRPGGVSRRDQDGIRWILLDNPAAHNALTVGMMRRLAEEVRELQHFEGAAVVLASAHGGSFCAGGHLGQVREALVHQDAARVMSTEVGVVLDALGQLPVVSISLIEGAAIGGGVELASATDFRAGTAEAFFDPAQVRLGVACGWGGAARLAARIGRGSALRFLACSRRVGAAEAAELGLLDAVVDAPSDVMQAVLPGVDVHRWAPSMRAVKRQILGEDPVEAFLSVWGGPRHRAALGLTAGDDDAAPRG